MKIRAELHLDDRPGTTRSAKVILVAKPEETLDHLALKLAAFALFIASEPIVEPSSSHAALNGVDFKPDLFVLDSAGDISVWIECGVVSIQKLNKVTRVFPRARVVVLKEQLRGAERLRAELTEQIRMASRIEIWTWPEGTFEQFKKALADKTELYGEIGERSFNLVVNHTPYAVDLVSV